MQKLYLTTTAILLTILLLPKLCTALLIFLLAGRLPLINLAVDSGVVFTISVLFSCGILAHLLISFIETFWQTNPSKPMRKAALSAAHYHRHS